MTYNETPIRRFKSITVILFTSKVDHSPCWPQEYEVIPEMYYQVGIQAMGNEGEVESIEDPEIEVRTAG